MPPIARPVHHGVGVIALGRGCVFALMFCASLVLPHIGSANASWLAKVTGAAEHVAPQVAGRMGASTLEAAARHLRSLPAKADGGVALAAQSTQEGHWRFVNKAGETFTAGTPEELKRAAAVLLPEAKADAKLSLYVTEDTVFQNRAALKDLPKGTDLHVVVGSESYRILTRRDGTVERLFAEVRPALIVELADRSQFEEAIWQLARPLDRASVRVLALEPGGPPRLAAAPRADPATKRIMVDAIDPASLPAALGSVRGQTVLVTGRVDGRLLYVQPSSGAERSILLPDLVKAAEEADVNLIVLRTASTPRQPGGRNWLWQKVEVRGLEQAMQHPRVADFLDALVGSSRRMTVTATASGRRTAIDIKPTVEFPAPLQTPVGDLFSGIFSDVTGRVITTGLEASLRSAERQTELDQRIIPGIPSDFQAGYLVLVLLGLFGVPISRAWWRRVWPPENQGEYAGRFGYQAARIVRGGLFLLIFLPLTAPLTASLNLWRQTREVVAAPARLWRRLTGRKATAGASA